MSDTLDEFKKVKKNFKIGDFVKFFDEHTGRCDYGVIVKKTKDDYDFPAWKIVWINYTDFQDGKYRNFSLENVVNANEYRQLFLDEVE